MTLAQTSQAAAPTTYNTITTVIVLMLSVVVFALLAAKISVPYPTMMVVGGVVICFLPNLQAFSIDPTIIFILFLPPLLYGAAWQMSWKDFSQNRRTITSLALGLVVFTTVGIALIARFFLPDITWAAAFALGAIVSPTDAIAVVALAKKLRLPRRVVFLLDGESLLNDASALVIYKFAIAAALATGGQFSLAYASGQFVLVVVMGIGIGLAIGYLVSEIHRRVRDPLIETTITFITPYVAYMLADRLQFSGVLSTVAAGLFVSWRAPDVMTPQERVQATIVWDFVMFMMNGFVFVLVGLGLPSVLRELPSYSTGQLLYYSALVVGGMILLRMAWVVPGTFLPWLLSKKQRQTVQRPSMRQSILIGWIGMRGAISLAAALALPLNFPGRGLIIFLTFIAILVTLVFQSLTLTAVVKLLKVSTTEDEAAEEREARLHATRVALTFLKDLTESTDAFGDAGKELRETYEKRIIRLESGPLLKPLYEVGIETSTMDLKREVLSAERQAIVELRATQKISIEVYQRLMADLDVEELGSGHR